MSGDAGRYQPLCGAGAAAIAVVRVTGDGVPAFIARHAQAPRRFETAAPGDVRRATLLDAQGAPLDDILISVHARPPDAEWDVRLHLHGGPFTQRTCAQLLAAAGFAAAALAPGDVWDASDALERALLDGLPAMLTRDGVAWLLRNATILRAELQAIAAGDARAERWGVLCARPDVATWFSRPLRVALVGPPNAGKSTLLNALADHEVSIAHAVAGTTRDWVSALGEVAGFPVEWIDTAGERAGGDELEAAGIALGRRAAAAADVVVEVRDVSAPADETPLAPAAPGGGGPPRVRAWNKIDRPAVAVADCAGVRVSALERRGLTELESAVLAAAGRSATALDAPTLFGRLRAGLRGAEDPVAAARRLLAGGGCLS